MFSAIYSVTARLPSIATMASQSVMNSQSILCRISASSPILNMCRQLHYPGGSPTKEKKKAEFPVRTWQNDRYKLENAYHRKKFYGPDRRFYTKNGLKIVWRKILKGRHHLHH